MAKKSAARGYVALFLKEDPAIIAELDRIATERGSSRAAVARQAFREAIQADKDASE